MAARELSVLVPARIRPYCDPTLRAREEDTVSQSLYERIGGEAAIMAAVDLFYAKVLANGLTRPFFEGLDIEAQIRKQIAFMSWALGGPESYKGRDLTTAHAHLVRNNGLSDAHFDAVVGSLEQTLQELGVERMLIDEVLALLGSTRADVLGRGSSG
jgi:hemoglobin